MKKINCQLKDFCDIPGLDEGSIPQGICFSQKYNILIISSYFKEKKASSLYLINFKNKQFIKKVELYNLDNTIYTGHVGGIATNDEFVWITGKYNVVTLKLDEVVNSNIIKISKIDNITNKADNASFSNNILWIGEYDYKKIYKTKKEHHQISNYEKNRSLLFGYGNLDNLEFDRPDFVISIPNKVQGIVQDENGNIYLSRSFWSFQLSLLTVFNNPLEQEPVCYYKINNNEVPLFYLSNSDILSEINMPPMSEAISLVNNDIFILFESASKLYKSYTTIITDKIKCIKLEDIYQK